jgi:hypothetical protein
VKGRAAVHYLVGRGSREAARLTRGDRRIPIKEWVRPMDAPSRGAALGHGSDFAMRSTEGRNKLVGASPDLSLFTFHLSRLLSGPAADKAFD